MDRAKLKQELIRDEGLRLAAYQDSVGLWTIGIGHLLGTEKRMNLITPSECDALYEADVDLAERWIRSLLPEMFYWDGPPLYDSRNRALVNMAFNLGPRLKEFKKFLDAVKHGDWDIAAKEMMDSKWAKQVGARAERLRDMILKGE